MKRNDSSIPDQIDAALAEYLRPAPVDATLVRRIAAAARRRARRLDRLVVSLAIEATERGVCRIHRGRTAAPPRGPARRVAEQAREELSEYFSGRRAFFSVPVDLGGAPRFQSKVLRQACRIPFGQARSYGWLAKCIGNPGAQRAVGTALGRNPVPFIGPCHRILRGDGSLGGYGLGLDLKRLLLALERTTPVLEGCTTTGIICRVGCSALRRVRPDRRVVFASVEDALSVGYRACRICAPAGAAVPRTAGQRAEDRRSGRS